MSFNHQNVLSPFVKLDKDAPAEKILAVMSHDDKGVYTSFDEDIVFKIRPLTRSSKDNP